MTVADDARATHWLTHVSYYRLSGYWHIWKDRSVADVTRFRAGTDFDRACSLYEFDRELRAVVGRAVEHVEVALRGSWAYALAHRGGPHGYLDAALYSDRGTFHGLLGKVATDTGRSAETYIRRYRDQYDAPALPAVWMVAEMMSFGRLSRWYSLVAAPDLRTAIAAPLGLREELFVSIVKHLVDVRNICAHHGRLWNRGFRSPPRLPHRPRDLGASLDTARVGHAAGTLYNSLVLLIYLVRQIAPSSPWRDDLVAALGTRLPDERAAMGFPTDWQARPLWL
ncbi:Abi family protein [Sphingomonas qilianensis]|uniref:Abi family protein n=2 Tax=Sphingomonas qilianensis TaxID=1736690 RepID=A0ABU9XTL2_9SPHN